MDEQETWSEENSLLYQQIAAVAVPAREEQIATLLTLLPFGRDEPFKAVELAAGEGFLSRALLDLFPRATVTALDWSAEMRQRTTERLRPHEARSMVAPFDIAQEDWLPHLDGADCVLSSLCIHHVPDEGKRRLFAAVAARLSARGALLIADLVAPIRPEANAVYAAGWDRAAEAQSREQTGSPAAYEQFVATRWNWYRYPDPFDQPAPLFDQLLWLREAGFAAVDCFWLRAGHAIYGGYTRAERAAWTERVVFGEALEIAREALGTDLSG
jgi:tRNA (cmo5U34)-methyltransferase